MQKPPILPLALCFALCAPLLHADTIVMKNGKQLQGIVRDDGGARIEVKTDNMDIWVDREQVLDVRRESPPDYFLTQGLAKLNQQDYEGARAAFKQALDMDPANEVAIRNLEALNAMSMRQRRAAELRRRDTTVQQLVAGAHDLADRALDDEALEALEVAVEKDPANREALELATDVAARLWMKYKVPESTVTKYAEALAKLDPDNEQVAHARQMIEAFKNRREVLREQDMKRLYGEILQAHNAREYDYRLMNKIERLLEMQPDDKTKQRLAQIQAAAREAGVGRIAITSTSRLEYRAAPGAAAATPAAGSGAVRPAPSGPAPYYNAEIFTGR